jgi:hypothetical protein
MGTRDMRAVRASIRRPPRTYGERKPRSSRHSDLGSWTNNARGKADGDKLRLRSSSQQLGTFVSASSKGEKSTNLMVDFSKEVNDDVTKKSGW